MRTKRVVYRVSRAKSKILDEFTHELSGELLLVCRESLQDLYISTLLSPTLRYMVLGENDESARADAECSKFYLQKFRESIDTGDPEYDFTVGIHIWTYHKDVLLEPEVGKPVRGCYEVFEKHPSLARLEMPKAVADHTIPRSTVWVLTPDTFSSVDPANIRIF